MTFDEYFEKEFGKQFSRFEGLFEKCWETATESVKPRWIPVSERLPEREGAYPVKINHKLSSFHKGYFDESKNAFDRVYFSQQFNEVTHWFDLPELPE